jgi:leucyl aminopeptidase (aminopeptidase T)
MGDEGRLRTLAWEGAERVLSECVPLRRGDTVAMFFDEPTEDCALILENAAKSMGLRFDQRRVEAAEQKKWAEAGRLDPEDEWAIEEARAVLISLSSKESGMPYRRNLVRRAVDDMRYVGLMPGATLELLAYAVNIDYEKVERRCDDLAVAMLAGKEAVLTTYLPRHNGTQPKACHLTLDLGGFARSPITSTGIIPLGTWGNLPGGETFIAPLEERASGAYVLNGAYTGRVLEPDRPLLLEFDLGQLVNTGGLAEECETFRAMLRAAGGGCIPKRLGLAELGIGVNEGLEGLTGNALFDEKKEGTAHVAVGDNSIYGGNLQSPLHEDFITQAPSLTIDGKPILDRGRYVLQSSDWREDRRMAERLGRELPREFALQRAGLHGNGDHSGSMRVTRPVGDQRKCAYTVGAADISPDVARLYGLLPPAYESIGYSVLYDKWRRIRGNESDEYVRGLVAVLCRHHLTQIEN